ncbi:beta-hexosaminidase beta chain precursor, putative [Entamoeba invadens IP1]|uniref:Beta-hexosaminidase n=1 Tax=Entamoeba invadens IP1 TaxID=370355 RepID=L7FLX7_ENTIV|nr:beta-hexosaminidase beta chain precursor, putative [Entamoeba invadens IP1]ELP87610.1 beta-hexosaminidase beta chain precursor, putative [Entamoeba invadens IP1]|eukprot:XP_004254381.1 beta-hexosaminidase beta chain precursor, putative [Entamoeba invadens IP1]
MLFVALLLSAALAGNGNNVKGKLLLVPYPQIVEANFLNPTSISATSKITYTLSDNCKGNTECVEFVKNNFNHSITFPLQRQMNLDDFRLSLFAPIDLINLTPDIQNSVQTISIELTAEDFFPELTIGVDESYTLDITTESISIKAPTVFGLRNSFETLVQLFRPYNGKYVITQVPISIKDFPRFKWRGLMVDCARNPFTLSTYYKIINAMAMFKSNMLHLHLTDGQTFLFESTEYPLLSQKGSYTQKKVLTQKFLKELIAYAKTRGIIVYPEIDLPAHAASWGIGYPDIVADCWDYIKTWTYNENLPALNPVTDETFKVLDALFGKELPSVFTSEYIHIGGDEMNEVAWSRSKEVSAINAWMTEKGIKTYLDLEGYFNKYVQTQVINANKKGVAWEEVYAKGNADLSTVIQVWSNITYLKMAVDDGYKAIWSEGLYLDVQAPACPDSERVEKGCKVSHMYVWTNRDFYNSDPTIDFSPEELENVLGAEAASWHESVDDQNVMERIFQRYGAISERLWSPSYYTDADSLEVRADYLRCVGLRRNILKGSGPLYHSYCQLPENL